jgi:hypothetical protein
MMHEILSNFIAYLVIIPAFVPVPRHSETWLYNLPYVRERLFLFQIALKCHNSSLSLQIKPIIKNNQS